MKAITAFALLALGSQAAEASAETLRFISCPVYRDVDAGKKSGCWLTDDPATGLRYDITQSPNKPDWNFAVLVEGNVAEATAGAPLADPCGGIVLEPVRVSVLEQGCTRAMIPAENYPGRRFILPERNVRPLYAKREAVPQPYATRDFVIPFDFGRDFIVYQLSDYYLDRAVNYALDIQASRVEITGYAATTPSVVSGQRIVETKAIAKSRAERARDWMRMRGVPVDHISISWKGTNIARPSAETDGLAAPSLRRVDIRVIP